MMNEDLYPHMYITFRYGQLSGLVEPIAGLLGAALVAIIVPILPYALAFAAVENPYLFDGILLLVIFQQVQPTGHMQGAMVYVVVDDIVPEAQSQGNGRAASWGAVVIFWFNFQIYKVSFLQVGFIVMMSLDVALG